MAIDFPSSPTTGQQYTFAGVTYTYTAQGVWSSGSGVGGYTASSTAPTSPTPGDHWYDLSTGILSIFVNDGNSSQWVMVSPTGGGGNFIARDATSTISVGYTFTPNNLGNIASPFTVNPALGNYQFGTNHAAATWNAPVSDCAVDILVTNDATAGAISFSGFTTGSNVGDALTTTNGNKFIISMRRINSISTYTVKALQ